MITERLDEFFKIYGNDQETVLNIIKEEYEKFCDIKSISENENKIYIIPTSDKPIKIVYEKHFIKDI